MRIADGTEPTSLDPLALVVLGLPICSWRLVDYYSWERAPFAPAHLAMGKPKMW